MKSTFISNLFTQQRKNVHQPWPLATFNENITYKVVSKTETHITKVDIKRPNIIKVEQILPQQSQSVPPSPRTNAPFNTFPQLKQPRKLPPLKPVNQSMIGLTGRRVVMNNRFKMFK